MIDKETFMGFVDNYLDGLLSESEKIDFELYIKKNPQKLKEIELHKKLRKIIEIKGRQEKLNELDAYREKFDKNMKGFHVYGININRKIYKVISYGIAASVLIIIASIYLINDGIVNSIFLSENRKPNYKNESIILDSLFSKADSSRIHSYLHSTNSYELIYVGIIPSELISNEEFYERAPTGKIEIEIYCCALQNKYKILDDKLIVFLKDQIKISSCKVIINDETTIDLIINNQTKMTIMLIK